MDECPIEIVHEMMNNLDDASWIVCNYVLLGSSMKRCYRKLAVPRRFSDELFKAKPAFVCFFWRHVKYELYERAARVGNRELIEWAQIPKSFVNGPSWLQDTIPRPVDIHAIALAAAKSGDIALCKFVRSDLYEPGNRDWSGFLAGSVECGHIDIFEWAYKDAAPHLGVRHIEGFRNQALINGNVNIARLLGTLGTRDLEFVLQSNNPSAVREIVDPTFAARWIATYGDPPIHWISSSNMRAFPDLVAVWKPCRRTDPNDVMDWDTIRWMMAHGHEIYCHSFGALYDKGCPGDLIVEIIKYCCADDRKLFLAFVVCNCVEQVASMANSSLLGAHFESYAPTYEMYQLLIKLCEKFGVKSVPPTFVLCNRLNRFDLVTEIDRMLLIDCIFSNIYFVVERHIEESKYDMRPLLTYARSIKMLRILVATSGWTSKFVQHVIEIDWLEGLQWSLSPTDVDRSSKTMPEFDYTSALNLAKKLERTFIVAWLELRETRMDRDFEIIWNFIELGIDNPPTISAVGAQNTGKSTTLNRLAGVNIFPQRRAGDSYNEGLTRCVINVMTMPSDTWRVWFKHGDDVQQGEFPTREQLEHEVYAFVAKQQKESKHKLPNGLITVSIYMRIFGPGLQPIIFQDNPGLVTDNQELAKPLRKMSTSSVKNRNSVVLFFINAALDVHSSPAWYAVNEAAGRVLVVITKPDLAGGKGAGIQEIMSTGIHRIPSSSIFVVKGPDMVAGDTKWNADAETSFFKTEMPTICSSFPNRIGVETLRSAARDALVGIYRDRVSYYKEKIGQMIVDCNTQIHELGEGITGFNRAIRYRECVELFCNAAYNKAWERFTVWDGASSDYISRNCQFLQTALHVSFVGQYNPIIWERLTEASLLLIDEREISTFVDTFRAVLRDKQFLPPTIRDLGPFSIGILGSQPVPIPYASFVTASVKGQFIHKTIHTVIKNSLMANTELVQFVEETPLIAEKRTRLGLRLQQLNTLLRML